MQQRFLGLVLSVGLVAAVSSAALAANVAASDKAFMAHAAQGGMAEVQLGQLAKKNGHSRRVRAFGTQMTLDHGKANKELMALADKLGVTLPWQLDKASRATVARLSKLTGEAFDKAYMAAMVEDHEKDVADFKTEAKSGKTAAVKDWAARTLPTLEMHLKMATGNAKAEHQEGKMKPGAKPKHK
jgi:putative membrane protein